MPRFTTADQLRDELNLDSNVQNATLERYLDGREEFAERFCRRWFAPRPALVAGEPPTDTAPPVSVERTVREGQRTVRLPGLRELVAADLDGTTWAEWDDFEIADSQGPALLLTVVEPLTSTDFVGRRRATTLTLTGRWGFNPVPGDVVEAVVGMAARRYRERDAAYADQVETAQGEILNYFRSLPSWIRETLLTYQVRTSALVGAGS